jgi:hypothetical protein
MDYGRELAWSPPVLVTPLLHGPRQQASDKVATGAIIFVAMGRQTRIMAETERGSHVS